MDWRRATIGYWTGIIAISLMLAFGIVLFALHLMAASYSEVPHYISHFRLMPFAWLWVTGLCVFAAGCIALSFSLAASLPKGVWSRLTLVATSVVGPLALLLAIFPAAAPGAVTTWIGRVHEVAAIAMFMALGFAMISLFPALRWGWKPLAWSSLSIGLLFFALTPWMVRGFVLGTPDVAYSERIVVALHGTWLFTMGLWSRSETAPFVFAKSRRARQPLPTPTMPSATS
jgi:hypothetical protein